MNLDEMVAAVGFIMNGGKACRNENSLGWTKIVSGSEREGNMFSGEGEREAG